MQKKFLDIQVLRAFVICFNNLCWDRPTIDVNVNKICFKWNKDLFISVAMQLADQKI